MVYACSSGVLFDLERHLRTYVDVYVHGYICFTYAYTCVREREWERERD